MEHLLKGVAIGFAIAAPVGPINLLCLRRSLADGRRVGFVSGLGAAAADTSYGILAAIGLTAVTSFLVGHRAWLQFFGGLFLVALGVGTMRAGKARRDLAAPLQVGRLRDAFISTYVLTLANPMTILAFTSVFATLGLGWQAGQTLEALELIGGVFLGSSLWWLTLTMLAGTFGHHLDDGTLQWINRIAGGVMAAFGLWQFALAGATWLPLVTAPH
ncbi:MAG TPA: LysE family transporter [Opitutaceae bacterium]|jgi:threonine/homoserine/homoserine lactone efflux protein|nr:LysE family transporter [Opitutaceae bacterium]